MLLLQIGSLILKKTVQLYFFDLFCYEINYWTGRNIFSDVLSGIFFAIKRSDTIVFIYLYEHH